MSMHFSANQYEQPFKAKNLQNWEVDQKYRERPRAPDGFTQIIANDRGHLLSGVQRSDKSPWGEFVGTWDMPCRIQGNYPTLMARSEQSVRKIEANLGKSLNKSINRSLPISKEEKRCLQPEVSINDINEDAAKEVDLE